MAWGQDGSSLGASVFIGFEISRLGAQNEQQPCQKVLVAMVHILVMTSNKAFIVADGRAQLMLQWGIQVSKPQPARLRGTESENYGKVYFEHADSLLLYQMDARNVTRSVVSRGRC